MPYPNDLDLTWHEMQLGIYTNSGNFPVYLNAQMRDKQISFQANAEFSKIPGGHRFVPRLWAKAKIDYLLDQISIYGELDELVDQVIELSLKFQILTPYTAFYADPNTDVAERETLEIPDGFILHQNYPNPFNPETTIRYDLPTPGQVIVKVYDIAGRLVKILFNVSQSAGSHTIHWDSTDMLGNPVSAGIYIYHIEFIAANGEKFIQCRKMSLVR
jgi:hypothetical protein